MWQLVVPTDPVGFWTMALTVATLLLAAVAWRGLRSLKLTKADILARAHREARLSAILRCEEMAFKIIPTNREISARLGAAAVPVFLNAADAVTFKSPPSPELLARARQWCQALAPESFREIQGHVNCLEAWASYFTNGVADHKVAFGPCAPVYRQQVAQYYPLLIHLRSSPTSGKFPNLTRLFDQWSHDLELEKSNLEVKELVTKINELQRRPVRGSAEGLPSPLGTTNLD